MKGLKYLPTQDDHQITCQQRMRNNTLQDGCLIIVHFRTLFLYMELLFSSSISLLLFLTLSFSRVFSLAKAGDFAKGCKIIPAPYLTLQSYPQSSFARDAMRVPDRVLQI